MKKRVGIIVTDLMGGDAGWQICSEEDYNTIINFKPTKKWQSQYEEEKDVLDIDKFQEMVGEYFYDKEKDDDNEKVLKHFFTQTFAPEKVDLSEYEIIGILTLPGG